jgi:hypothetical protein
VSEAVLHCVVVVIVKGVLVLVLSVQMLYLLRFHHGRDFERWVVRCSVVL